MPATAQDETETQEQQTSQRRPQRRWGAQGLCIHGVNIVILILHGLRVLHISVFSET